jgi:hypothetical protein
LAVLDGIVSPDDVIVELRFDDGASVLLDDRPSRTVKVEDPGTESQWTARSQPTRSGRYGRRRPLTCAVVSLDGGPAPGGGCGDLEEDPFFFRAVEQRDSEGTLQRTSVAGIKDRSVASITVADSQSQHPVAIARRGGAFLAVPSPAAPLSELTITVTFTDGSREVFVGRSEANVSHTP